MDLILREDDLGIDIWDSYLSSIFSDTTMPNFGMIYESYKIDFLVKETEMTSEAVDRSLIALKEGTLDLGFLDIAMREPKPEMEVFDHLLKQGLSFHLRGKLFNYPAKEVW
jgi:hypothetical protein